MYPKELIRKIHQSLPPELLEPIASEETLGAVDLIADEGTLTGEQAGKLESLVTFRIMGLVQEKDFSKKIEENLKVTPDIANGIMGKVIDKILKNIPTELLKSQEERSQAELKSTTPEDPIVITNETKVEALKELGRREDTAKEEVGDLPEIPPKNLPMIEEGEVAHEVPVIPAAEPTIHIKEDLKSDTPKLSIPTPDYRYPGGKDPYREPTN